MEQSRTRFIPNERDEDPPQRPLVKNLCWKIAVLLGIVCVDWVAREHDSLAKNPFRGTSDARVKFILRTLNVLASLSTPHK